MTNHPERCGNYVLDRPLGKGGTSQVWLARHYLLRDRLVAVKLLLTQDPEWIERFSREAEIIWRLRHPQIVQVYDHGQAMPYYYTLMEYVQGGALRDRLRPGRPLPVEQALHVFRGVASALDYAHSQGVIHRDVSPGNILIEDRTGRVLLTDFGIARESSKVALTTMNKMMGTPGYLSPEHSHSATAVTSLSDVYGLGVVLYEMLSGALPWNYNPGIPDESGGPFAAPMPLRSRNITGLPPDVDRVLQTMLAIEPAKRYPTALAAVDDLDRVMKRHNSTTQIYPSDAVPQGSDAKALAPRTVEVATVEPHAVEQVLNRDLIKGPLQEARLLTTYLSDQRHLSTLLDRWSEAHWYRRPLLGRLANIHKLTSSHLYFYRLRVLAETRQPAKTVSEPDYKATEPPKLVKALDRWDVKLDAPRDLNDEGRGTLRLPGSVRVSTCTTCAGVGRTRCPHCEGRARIPAPNLAAPTGTAVRRAPAGTTGGTPTTGQPIGEQTGATQRPAAPTGRRRRDSMQTDLEQLLNTPVAPAVGAAQEARLIPCPHCNGSGGVKCTTCDSIGRLLEYKQMYWERNSLVFEEQDALPRADRERVQRLCRPKTIYREQQTGGFRPEWQHVPALAALIRQAEGRMDQDTRVALCEVQIDFVPISEILFDLGKLPPPPPLPTPGKKGQPAKAVPVKAAETGLYRWRIYGFEQLLLDDRRFLHWERITAISGVGVALILLALLIVSIVVL